MLYLLATNAIETKNMFDQQVDFLYVFLAKFIPLISYLYYYGFLLGFQITDYIVYCGEISKKKNGKSFSM